MDNFFNVTAAIIGFGGMGQRHYHAYTKLGISVIAICDINTQLIKTVLPDFPKEKIYSSYQDLLSNEFPNVISIVTNGPSHADISVYASNLGISYILCEKPIATSINHALKTINTCKINKTRLSVNHIRRWSPNYLSLKQNFKSGIIGEIRQFYFNCGSTGLGNFAIHFIDTARMLVESDPDWIIGMTDKTGTQNPRGKQFHDPGGYGIVHFKNGVRMFLDTSEDTGVQYTFQIVGTYGRVIIDERNNIWQIRRRTRDLQKIPLTRYDTDMEEIQFESEQHDIVDLTRRGIEELLLDGELSSTGEDGMKSLEVVVGFHVSDAEKNRKISLPLAHKYQNITIEIA